MKKVSTLLTLLLIAGFVSTKAQWAGKIVFSLPSATPGHDSICAINPDGTGFEFITNGSCPRLAPGGNRIAYLQGTRQNRNLNDIYFKDGTGTPYQFFDNGSQEKIVNFDFSPQGSFFQYDWSGGFYRMDADLANGGASYIGSGRGDFNDVFPRVNPVDSQVAFYNYGYGIYVMAYEGLGGTPPVPNTTGGDVCPSWSPDGQWVYFMKQYTVGTFTMHNIYKIHPDGTNLTQVTNLPNTDTLGMTMVVTKNGKWAVAPARIKGVMGLYKFRLDQAVPDNLGFLVRDFNYLLSPENTLWLGSVDSVNDDISMAIADVQVLAGGVYPNPASNILTVTLSTPENAITVKVFNALGEAVLDNHFVNTNSMNLDVHGLPAGGYLIKATADAKQFTTRFIKQ